MIIEISLIVLAIALVAWGYNTIVKARITAEAAWAQVDVQLKRRYDLIPNLIETVKGYASHEQDTLNLVTTARANALNASSPSESAKAEGILTQTLKSLFAVSESYPDLKASANFLSLQEELSTTENKIAFARQYYNEAVRRLNTLISTYPLRLLKGSTKAADFFAAPDGDTEIPLVKF
jgi:LemA protein